MLEEVSHTMVDFMQMKCFSADDEALGSFGGQPPISRTPVNNPCGKNR